MERGSDLRSTRTEPDEPHRASVGDQLADALRLAHNDRLLELDVEQHVEHLGGERLVELAAGLLPGSDAVGRPRDLDEAHKLRQPERIAQLAAAGRRLVQKRSRDPGLPALLGGAHQLADLRLRQPPRVVRSRWHSVRMVAQRFEEYNIPEGSLLARYVRGQDEMDRLHDGRLLRVAARSVLAQVPDGSVTLLATSEAGAGLAAACAVLREQPTKWRHINVLTDGNEAIDPVVVVLDPVDAGEGWRAALLRRFPVAIFVTPTGLDEQLGVAA